MMNGQNVKKMDFNKPFQFKDKKKTKAKVRIKEGTILEAVTTGGVSTGISVENLAITYFT